MPKQYQFRYDDKIKKEIRKTVQAYNSKLTRVTKRNPEMESIMPSRTSVQSILSTAQAENWKRKDVQRELKSLNRFMKKGAELPMVKNGVIATVYEIKEFQYSATANERRKAKERERYSAEKGNLSQINRNSLREGYAKPQTIEEMRKATKGFKKGVNKGLREKQLLDYRYNYLIANSKGLGEHADKIAELTKGLTNEQLFDATESPELTIDFLSNYKFYEDDKDVVADRVFNSWYTHIMGNDGLKIDINEHKSVFIAQNRVNRKNKGMAQLTPEEEEKLYSDSLSN